MPQAATDRQTRDCEAKGALLQLPLRMQNKRGEPDRRNKEATEEGTKDKWKIEIAQVETEVLTGRQKRIQL